MGTNPPRKSNPFEDAFAQYDSPSVTSGPQAPASGPLPTATSPRTEPDTDDDNTPIPLLQEPPRPANVTDYSPNAEPPPLPQPAPPKTAPPRGPHHAKDEESDPELVFPKPNSTSKHLLLLGMVATVTLGGIIGFVVIVTQNGTPPLASAPELAEAPPPTTEIASPAEPPPATARTTPPPGVPTPVPAPAPATAPARPLEPVFPKRPPFPRAEIEPRLLQSTFFVAGKETENHGSGVLIHRERRLILTAYSAVGESVRVVVIEPQSEANSRITDPAFYLREAHRLGRTGAVRYRDPRRQLALIEVENLPRDVHPLALARSSAQPTDAVYSLGESEGKLWELAEGRVRGRAEPVEPDGEPDQRARLLVFRPKKLNDSGGPTVNRWGNLTALVQTDTPAHEPAQDTERQELHSFLQAYAQGQGFVWDGPAPDSDPYQEYAVQHRNITEKWRSDDPQDQVEATQTILRAGGTGEYDTLIQQALMDPAAAMRLRAIAVARQLATDARQAERWLGPLVHDSEPDVAIAARFALDRWQVIPTELGPALRDQLVILLHGVNEPSKLAALRQLAAAGPKAGDAAPALAKLLAIESSEAVQVAICDTLRRFGVAGSAGAVPLLELMNQRQHPLVVQLWAAVKDLGITGLDPLNTPHLAAELRKTALDTTPWAADPLSLAIIALGGDDLAQRLLPRTQFSTRNTAKVSAKFKTPAGKLSGREQFWATAVLAQIPVESLSPAVQMDVAKRLQAIAELDPNPECAKAAREGLARFRSSRDGANR